MYVLLHGVWVQKVLSVYYLLRPNSLCYVLSKLKNKKNIVYIKL